MGDFNSFSPLDKNDLSSGTTLNYQVHQTISRQWVRYS